MTSDDRSAGFSLAELLVAMLVTMLVSGAVFGLLSAGQGAFRREPELTDRQQNIRLAMDLIQRDLATAGLSIGASDQVFRPAQNGVNILLPPGPSTRALDALELVGNDGQCADTPGTTTAANPLQVTTAFNLPGCFGLVGSIVPIGVTSTTGTQWGYATLTTARQIDFRPTASQPNMAAGLTGTGSAIALPAGAVTVARLQLVRYEVATETGDTVPSLYRSWTGGTNPSTPLTPVAPNAPTAATANWQMLARGIEDFQVRYRAPAVVYADVPPNYVFPGACTQQVREVEVTLWARSISSNLQGIRTDGGSAAAVRGALTSVTTPRAVLMNSIGSTVPACVWQ